MFGRMMRGYKEAARKAVKLRNRYDGSLMGRAGRGEGNTLTIASSRYATLYSRDCTRFGFRDDDLYARWRARTRYADYAKVLLLLDSCAEHVFGFGGGAITGPIRSYF